MNTLAHRISDVILGMTTPQANWFEALYAASLDQVGDPIAALEKAKAAWLEHPVPGVSKLDLAYDVGRRSLDLAEQEPEDASAVLLAMLQATIEAKESGDESQLEDLYDQLIGLAGDSVDLAWTSQQSRTGKVKAVGTGEHAGRTLYGDAALRVLQKAEAKADPQNAGQQASAQEKPKGKRVKGEESAKAAGDIARQITEAGRATAEQVEQLSQHLPSLSVEQLKGVAKVIGTKVGGKKQELADRLLAKAKEAIAATAETPKADATLPTVETAKADTSPLQRLADLMGKGHDKLTPDERAEAVTHANSLLPFLQQLGVIPDSGKQEQTPIVDQPEAKTESNVPTDTTTTAMDAAQAKEKQPHEMTLEEYKEKHYINPANIGGKPPHLHMTSRSYDVGVSLIASVHDNPKFRHSPPLEVIREAENLAAEKLEQAKLKVVQAPGSDRAKKLQIEAVQVGLAKAIEDAKAYYADGKKPTQFPGWIRQSETRNGARRSEIAAENLANILRQKYPEDSEMDADAAYNRLQTSRATTSKSTASKASASLKALPANDPGEYKGDPGLVYSYGQHEQKRRELLPPASPEAIRTAIQAVQQHGNSDPLLAGLGSYPEAYAIVKDSPLFPTPQHFMRAISDAIDQGHIEFRTNNDSNLFLEHYPNIGMFAVPHRNDKISGGVATWGRVTPSGKSLLSE